MHVAVDLQTNKSTLQVHTNTSDFNIITKHAYFEGVEICSSTLKEQYMILQNRHLPIFSIVLLLI